MKYSTLCILKENIYLDEFTIHLIHY